MNKPKIYLAAPLFNEMERTRNMVARAEFSLAGFDVYLPQTDSGEAIKGTSRDDIFKLDVQGVKEADIIVAFVDGRVPDEGTCVELGMAYAWDKTIILITDDDRSFMDGHMNVMIEKIVTGKLGKSCVLRNAEQAASYLRALAK